MEMKDIVWRRRGFVQAMLAGGFAGSLGALGGCASVDDDKALDEEGAYQLGLNAYVYGYSMIYFARLRYQRMAGMPDPVAKRFLPLGGWLHRNAVVTPLTAGAPQTDTLYSTLWLDLRREPFVLTIPPMDGRYWSIQCCDMQGVTFGLPSRRTLPAGGRIALVGPDWKGALPDGLQAVYRSGMSQGMHTLRLFFASPDDRLKAIAYQDAFQVAPLSAYLRGQTNVPGTPGRPFMPLAPKDDPLADFKALQRVWQESPPPASDAALTRRFARISLGTPEVDGFAGLRPEVRRGLERAEAQGRKQVVEMTRALPGKRTQAGWTAPLPSIGYYGEDYAYRAAVTQAGTVALPVAENPYFVMQVEPSSGTRLNGDKRYQLRFDKSQIPQTSAFWSLHAYNDNYTVIANAIDRYSIGDRSEGLAYDTDGSLTVYVQSDDPGPSRRANWLPVKAGAPFWLIVRNYEPRGSMSDLTWVGPALSA